MATQKVPPKPDGIAQQLQERISKIERRDHELWVLALCMVGILALGFLLVIVPTVIYNPHSFYIQASLSSPLLAGLLIAVSLFLVYMVFKHFQIRNLRQHSVVEVLNFQISHVQMMLDPLTHAFNRNALEEVVGREIKRALRKEANLIFLYVDVDELKQVNSRFGHLSGDLVLREVGAILRSSVRGSDYIIRMGGDEFLVVLMDTDLPGAGVVKGRINERRERWNQDAPLPGFQLNMSIGIEQFDPTLSFDQVLANADGKMYTEKQAHAAARKSS